MISIVELDDVSTFDDVRERVRTLIQHHPLDAQGGLGTEYNEYSQMCALIEGVLYLVLSNEGSRLEKL